MAEAWGLLVETSSFFFAIWLIGYLCKSFLIPPVIGEITIGILLGPRVADLVPFTDVGADSLFAVLGTMGVTLVILESGSHVDIDRVREMGWRVVLVGLLGTLFPLGGGIAIFYALGYDPYPEAFTSAIIIAPASVGVALRVLDSMKKMGTSYSQYILTAATLDDLLALILFIVLQNITEDEIKAHSVALPIILAIVFIVVVSWLSYYWFPVGLSKIMYRLKKNAQHSFQLRDQFHLVSLFLVLAALSWVGHLLGSHLLGAFLAGLLYCRVPRSHYLWVTQIKQTLSWLLRLFFAATVAFSIPVEIMFSGEAIWQGVLVTLVCLVTKIGATLHLPKGDRWKTGWALCARGEFSFLVGEFALQQELIDEELYSVVVWGLLLSTLISPIMLQTLIRRDVAAETPDPPNTAFEVIIEGSRHQGQPQEVGAILDKFFDILETKIVASTNTEKEIRTVLPREKGHLSEQDLLEIKHELRDVIADPRVQIDINRTELPDQGMLEFEVMGNSLDKVMECLLKICSKHQLRIEEQQVDDHGHIKSCHVVTAGRIIDRATRDQIEESLTQSCEGSQIDAQVVVKLRPCEEI